MFWTLSLLSALCGCLKSFVYIVHRCRDFGPVFVEWINDSSCNVVFNDAFSAKRALHGKARGAGRTGGARPSQQTEAMRVHPVVCRRGLCPDLRRVFYQMEPRSAELSLLFLLLLFWLRLC